MAKSLAAGRLSVRTESRAKLFGAELVNSWSVSILDAGTGRPLEFLSVRPRKRAERWELAGKALSRTIMKPHPDSPDEPMEQWVVTQNKTWPPVPLEPATPGAVPAPGAGSAPAAGSPAGDGAGASPEAGAPADAPARAESGAPAAAPAPGASPAAGETPPLSDPSTWVHDYIAMLVRLGALPLHKVGDSATVRVATSRGAAPLRVSVGEERTEYRNLTNLATGRNTRYQLRELRLRVAPLAGSPPDARGFLDMEGETELWVDAATRTLVEISGTIPKVPGRVVITLAGYR